MREAFSSRFWRRRQGLVIAVTAGLLAGVAASLPFAVHASQAPPPSGNTSITAADVKLLYNAEQILIHNCMGQHGFRYSMTSLSDQVPDGPQLPVVISDVAWARRNGFGAESSATAPAADPNRQYYLGLPASRQALYLADIDGPEGSQAAQVVLPAGFTLGHSVDGCQAWAEGRLYGNYSQWFAAVNVVDGLPAFEQAEVQNDGSYQHAVTGWARCMRAGGYRYSTPSLAAAAFQDASTARLRQAGIHAAVAEAECADSTGLAATANHLVTYYAAAANKKYREEITDYKQMRLDAVPVARAVAG